MLAFGCRILSSWLDRLGRQCLPSFGGRMLFLEQQDAYQGDVPSRWDPGWGLAECRLGGNPLPRAGYALWPVQCRLVFCLITQNLENPCSVSLVEVLEKLGRGVHRGISRRGSSVFYLTPSCLALARLHSDHRHLPEY
jgi:hypothetical protein